MHTAAEELALPAYTIAWNDPYERQYAVTVSFTAAADGPRLFLPAWRPGRYLIQNYAANVSRWSASTAEGEPLRIAKSGKSVWQVEARAGQEVVVHYRYYAGVLDAGSSFLDDSKAYFNGSNLFMMVEGLRHEQAVLTIAVPEGWEIETQLPRRDADTWLARDYDHLIDSPTIVAHHLRRHTFTEAGATIHLVFLGADRIDTSLFVDPLRAIVRQQARMFDGLPLTAYRFLIQAGDRWHGVEHEESCSIIVKRSELLGAGPGDAGFDHLLSLASHEFFHLWNVKRIVPAVFAPYDYATETMTRLLWVMEGVTSYYGDLTLVRSGLWNETRYLAHLSAEMETLENLPGQHTLSLAQASFDAWLQNDVHDRANAVISFYNKGEVVAALLDLLMRSESGGEVSLDDVMLALWHQDKPIEEDAFEQAVRSLSEVGDFFERYVHGTERLPYEEILGRAGIAVHATRNGAPSLSASLRAVEGRLTVVNARQGGAGMKAGLLPGDEIISIDGMRMIAETDVSRVLRAVPAEESVEMIIARAGLIRSVALRPSPDARVTIKLEASGQNAMRSHWLRGTDA